MNAVVCSFPFQLWLVWALIGVIVGYMVNRLCRSAMMILSLLVGIVGAVIGGWVFMSLFDDIPNGAYLSLVSSVVICSISLWIFIRLTKEHSIDD